MMSGAARVPAVRIPETWEYDLLRLLAEQGAIPFDQLARFIDCEQAQAARVGRHLSRAGFADYGRSLIYEPHWVWLTRRGARFSGLGFPAKPPRLGAMARMRAVNEVRLQIRRRAPEARWISGRSAIREQGHRGPRPNAIVEIGSERHAIVVKHGIPQEPERELRIVESHLSRYDAVVYFANPRPMALLKRLQADHHWPKLVIRAIPRPQRRPRARQRTETAPANVLAT
jgi:hypothetical protein